jgi:hypothetical protein
MSDPDHPKPGFNSLAAACERAGPRVWAAISELARSPVATIKAFRAAVRNDELNVIGKCTVLETIADMEDNNAFIELFDDPDTLRALIAMCCGYRALVEEAESLRFQLEASRGG